MEIIARVETYLSKEQSNPTEAFDLLTELVDAKKMGARTRALLRRLGKNPKPKYAPHYEKELQRFLRMQKVSKKTAKQKQTVKAKPTAKKAAAKKTEYVAPPVVKTFTDDEYAKLPDNVKQFSAENIKLQRIRDKARHGLEMAKTDEERRELAGSISTMQEQIDSNFAALKYFKENGTLPEVNDEKEEASELTLSEAKDELRNARSRRSKAKSGLKNAKTKPTKEKYEGKLAEAESDVLKFENLVSKLEQNESLSNQED
jgi:predicted  nucleic acid-binding Zn-ribbon protein